MMIRHFLPVGQGACYLEQFKVYNNETINIIYDCGSSTSLDILHKCISEALKQEITIHAVFISHFDEDHINGLPFLLQNYNVKNLFIPLITEHEKSIMKLSQISGVSFNTNYYASNFFERFFNDYPYLDFVPCKVYFVEPINEINDDYEFQFKDIEDQTIKSGTNILPCLSLDNHSVLPEWVFVPYNFRQQSRYIELINELRKEFQRGIDLSNVFDLIKDNPINVKIIKRAFKRITGSLNANSMVLFSGTKNKTVMQHKVQGLFCSSMYCCQANNLPFFSTRSGCLYTGDYDAHGKRKWDKLKKQLTDYWDDIGSIQIPHHGSKSSYNEKLTDYPHCFYIISAGTNNSYRHPSNYVIKDMLFKGIYPLIVTEKKQSELFFIVE